MLMNRTRFFAPRCFLLTASIIIFNMILFLTPAHAEDFTARQISDYGNVTVMEVTGNFDENTPAGVPNVAPRQAVAKEFFRTHKDEYDFVTIFTNFDFVMKRDRVAFYYNVKNDVAGIGQQSYDKSSLYGSNGKLQGTIDMGNLLKLVTNPLDPKFDFTVDTIVHETLHRWSAYVKFKDWNGTVSDALLGEEKAHWSFLLDSGGSTLYGNKWKVNGDGTFTSTAVRKYYSPLDLYVMGMLDKSKVPPTLLIDNPSIDPVKMPEIGSTISGAARYVNIDDIIATEGERIPNANDSQKQFKSAFIYLVSPGTFNADDLYGIENIRNGFLTRFSILTDGKALVQVASTPKEDLPTNPGGQPPTTTPRTLPPNIDEGVNWLMSHQQTDGSWIDFELTPERDTAEAVSTLQLFPAAHPQLQTGLAWLGSSAPANTDYLARRLVSVIHAGGDGSALLQELLSRVGTDGGWGSGQSYYSNATDTALVLKALALAGYNDQSVTSRAIAFLQAAQNSDGGWSGSDTSSTIQPTAEVLTAYNSYGNVSSLADSISRGGAFLAGKQNPDGGFGNSPSTVYDTALATMALAAIGADRALVSRGSNYLLGQQSADGSWHDSPYQTALAVRAVWQASIEPDLAIKADDITIIPSRITSLPTTAVLSATVRNLGRSDVPSAKVAVYDGEITLGKKVAEQTLAFPGMSPTTVTFSVPISDGNGHNFYLAVDPDNQVAESNRSNNSAAKSLLPEATYDFVVVPSELSASPNQLELLQEMKITAKISNRGTADAYNVPVRFFIDEPGSPLDIATITVDIPAGASVVKEVVWKANRAGGSMPLTVQVDPLNAFSELSKENNKALTLVSVTNVTVTDSNLTLANNDIAVAPNPVNERGSVTITATARNDGFSPATDVKVNIYKGVPGKDGILLGTRTIASLAPGQTAPVSVDWGPINESGEKVIFVQLDPDNTIKEIAESDNDAFAILTVRSLPDLSVAIGSIIFSPSAPKDGDTVAIVVTVMNNGEQDAVDVPVQVREGLAVIGAQIIPLIKGRSQGAATFTYNATNGIHPITADVDPESRLVEQGRENNTITKTFAVQNAKLWLSEPYISPNGDGIKDSTRFFFRLDAESAVRVVVVNKAGETVRTFSGGELSATAGTTITWDGLNDSGMVVKDGMYQLQIRDLNSAILGSLPVVVDNNRSPLTEALGTKYLFKKDIGCNASFYGTDWSWLSDESGFVVGVNKGYGVENKVVYASTNGEALKTIVSDYLRTSDSFNQQPNGAKTSFVQQYIYNISLLISDKDNTVRTSSLGKVRIGEEVEQKWSADGSGLVVMLPTKTYWNSMIDRLFIVNDYGNGFLTEIPTNGDGLLFEWSPDSSHLAYVDSRKRVYLRNQGTGNSELIFTSPYTNTYTDISSLDWLDNNRLLISRYNYGTFIFDISTRTETKISAEHYPYLAPDKKKMLFVNGNGADLVAVDGTVISRFTSGNYSLAEYLEWSPDSRYAVLYIADAINELIALDTATTSTVAVAKGVDLFSVWFDETNLVYAVPAAYDKAGALNVFNMLTEKTDVLHIFNRGSLRVALDIAVSPLGNYLSWTDPYNSQCLTPSYNVAASMLNLTAKLTIASGSQNVALKGTAMDANFGGWKLEYAETSSPDSWYLVTPPSDVPVIDDAFATWAPPSAGTFTVRLTVWDKAGNQAVSRQRVSWGATSPVTNVYQSLNVFSPNGDGVKDTVEIYFSLLAPAHLDFVVYNSNNTAIMTGYAASGSDHLSWDGRDDAGSLVPDGKYKIKLLDYEFIVFVDTKAPDVALNLGRINPYYDAYNHFAFAELSGRIYDTMLRNWIIEYGEGENPQEWHEHDKGGSVVIKTDATGNPILTSAGDDLIEPFYSDGLLSLVGKKLRVTAEDLAGNKSSSMSGMIEERVVLLWIDDTPAQIALAQLQEFYRNTPGALTFITETVLHGGDSKEFFIYSKLKPALHQLQVLETLRAPVLSSRLQYYKRGWHDASAAITFDQGSSIFEFDNSSLDGIYAVRIKVVDVTGKEYLSNTILIGGDGEPGDSTPAPMPMPTGTVIGTIPEVTAASFEAKHMEADGCNLVSGKIELPAGKLLVQDAKELTLGLQTNGGLVMLSHIDLSSKSPASIIVETPNIPEGVYPLKAIFTFTDNSSKEILSRNEVFVDRTPPVSNINYPDNGQKPCLVKITDPQGNWTGIEVGGIVSDNIKVKRYELYYRTGENPAAWYPAMTGSSSQARPISGSAAVNGRIGVWNVGSLIGTSFTLKLKVVDEAGNVSCAVKSFTIDTVVQFSALSADPALFSPNNNDGIADEVKATFQIDENAATDVKVFRLLDGAQLESTPARTIVSGQQRLAGVSTVAWNGRDDAGLPAIDGRYGISVSAVDVCGNTALKWSPVEVDNTSPMVAITSPSTSPPLPAGNIVEVKGTAADLHFRSYTLEAGAGVTPSTWTAVATNTAPVNNGVLAVWNSFGLQGRWTLRLSAEDTAGNKGVFLSPVDLGIRSSLIKSLNASPQFFSPNGDQKLDNTIIDYEISDACQVKFEILDAMGQVVRIQPVMGLGAGVYSYSWDGKNSEGITLGDGLYTLKLTATLSADPQVSQTESITLTLDTISPILTITEPADNSFLNKADVSVRGSTNDSNLANYAIKLSGPAGTVGVDTGSQGRTDYTFGLIKGLPEETYTITAETKDRGENQTILARTFTIDRTPPKVTLETPKSGEFFGNTRNVATITGSIIEKNPARYSLRYGVGDTPALWQEVAGGDTLPTGLNLATWKVGKGDGVADGAYTLSLYSKDKSGLEGEAKLKLVIDNTPPLVAISSLKDGEYIKAALDISGTISDANLDKGQLEISQGRCNAAFKWSVLKSFSESVNNAVLESWKLLPADGEYCLRLSSIDKSGNSAETKVTVAIDTHPPAAPEVVGKVETKTESLLSWSRNSEPDLAGYNLYRDGKRVNAALLSNCQYLDSALGEGVYVYTVKAVDLAGNESANSNSVKIRIDLTGPNVRISSPQNGSKVSSVVDIRGTAFSSDDFKEYRILIGSGNSPSDWMLLRKSPVPLSLGTLSEWNSVGLVDESTFSIKLEAEDITGNISATQLSVTVDNNPPQAPVILTAVANGADAAINWNANSESDIAGYFLYRNGQPANVKGIMPANSQSYLIAGTTYQDRELPDGKYSYYLVAADHVGNNSRQSATLGVVVDTRPPHTVLVAPANGLQFEGVVQLKADSPDSDIANVQFQYKRPTEAAWSNLGSPITRAPYVAAFDPKALALGYSDYQVQAVATDTGGKLDPAPAFITVTFADLTPPAAPINLKTVVKGESVALSWAAGTDADLNGYNVYRIDGNYRHKLNTIVLKDAAYLDTNVPDGRYAYDVIAIDIYGNESGPSDRVSLTVFAPVLTQPHTPTAITSLQLTGGSVEVGFSVEVINETESGAVVAGSAIADGFGNFTADISGLAPGENRLTAKAFDSAGNVSRSSAMVVVVYNATPLAPTGLSGSSQAYDVGLSWNPNLESDIAGYNVYRNGSKLNFSIPMTGGGITASSNDYSNYQSQIANAIDQDGTTYWSSPYAYWEFDQQWLEVDFTAQQLVNHMDIHWGSKLDSMMKEVVYAGKDFEIQAWSGYTWIPLTKVVENSGKDTSFDFRPSYLTDKIRIIITTTTDQTSSSQVRINEIVILKDNLVGPQSSYSDINLHDGAYGYSITAVDQLGFESLPSAEVKVDVGDVIPPVAPQNLAATVILSDVTLDWSFSVNAEADLAGYNVYRDVSSGWVKVNGSLLSGKSFVDSGLRNGTYSYRITAVDTAGNESTPSTAVLAMVAVAKLQSPVNVRAVSLAEGEKLHVTWELAAGSITSCNMYRSMSAGGPYTKLNSVPLLAMSYLDVGLVNGTSYYYVVTGVDAFGNESDYSSEARGIPADTLLPGKPVLHSPTVAALPLTTTASETTIAGTADSAKTVELFHNGVSLGTFEPLAVDVSRADTLLHSTFSSSFSTDGKLMAYVDATNFKIWRRNLSTGETRQITNDIGRAVLWAPDGKRIAYTRPVNSAKQIMIFADDTGASIPLTEDRFVLEDYPCWSPDGTKLGFVSTRGGYQDLWVKDLKSGNLNRITTGYYVSLPRFSPDGQKISYFVGTRLYFYDLATAASSLVDSAVSGNLMDWSPDGTKLAFDTWKSGSAAVYLHDVGTQTQSLITAMPGTRLSLAWSPEGNNIAVVRREADWTYSLVVADLQGGTTALRRNIGALAAMDWLQSGEIYFLSQNQLTMTSLRGRFSLADVRLDSGENEFIAVAVDDAGNLSPAADAITVVFDNSLLPDLAVSGADIATYPPYPKPGEEVLIDVAVRNAGKEAVNSVRVDLYLWDVDGNLDLLETKTIPRISGNGLETVSVKMIAGGKVGPQSIIAVADPVNELRELLESNNYATGEFYVTGREEVFLSATLDKESYASNQSVSINVTLRNSGNEQSGNMEVLIQDANGNRVASVDSTPVIIPYGGNEGYSFLWNSDSVFAGTYQVHTIFKGSNGRMVEDTVAFNILPDVIIETSVITDKIKYSVGEYVNANINVRNNGNNYIIPQLKVVARIIGPAMTELFSEEKSITELFPATVNNLMSQWNTATNLPGVYQASIDVYFGDKMVATTVASFNIEPVSVVSGTLSFDSAAVNSGSTFTVQYSVLNTGNCSANGIVNVDILDPDNASAVAHAETEANILFNGSQQGSFSFSTVGLKLQQYIALLRFKSVTGQKNVASATIYVQDLIPPRLRVVAPIDGEIYKLGLDFKVMARDEASGLNKIDYQLDGGSWNPLPSINNVTGEYGSSWMPRSADNGPHTVSFRGMDKAGNSSTPVSVTFIVEHDITSPILTLSTLPNNSSTNVDVLNISGTVTDNTAVRDLFVNSTRVPFNVDGSFSLPLVLKPGENMVEVTAVDLADNKSVDSRTITLDQTFPLLTITAPADNSKTAVALLDVTGTVDETSTVEVKLGSSSQIAVMNGTAFTAGVTLVPGANTIEVTATDLANNSSSQKRSIIYDDQKPSLAITLPAQDIRTKEASLLLQGTASDPYTQVAVTIVVDGQSYNPTVVDGSFEQLLTFSAEKTYAIVVTATNEVESATVAQRNVIYDITSPLLSIDPVTTPTTENIQTVTGSRESDLDITVSCPTASVGTVTYPTATTWSVTISNMQSGDNTLTASASDSAGNSASVTAVITVGIPMPLFSHALFGHKSVSLSHGSYTGSNNEDHNCRNNDDDGENCHHEGDDDHGRGVHAGGNVGTNSIQLCGISLENGSRINGKAEVGYGGNPATGVCLHNGSEIKDHQVAALAAMKDMTAKTGPPGGKALGALKLVGGAVRTIMAGEYRSSSLELKNGGKLILDGKVTLHIDGNVAIDAGSKLTVTSGPVIIYLNGKKLALDNGAIVNKSGDPQNLTIYGTAALQAVNLAGNGNLQLLLHAPKAAIKISEGQHIDGSIIGNTIDMSGGSSVYFDSRSLR